MAHNETPIYERHAMNKQTPKTNSAAQQPTKLRRVEIFLEKLCLGKYYTEN